MGQKRMSFWRWVTPLTTNLSKVRTPQKVSVAYNKYHTTVSTKDTNINSLCFLLKIATQHTINNNIYVRYCYAFYVMNNYMYIDMCRYRMLEKIMSLPNDVKSVSTYYCAQHNGLNIPILNIKLISLSHPSYTEYLCTFNQCSWFWTS